MDTRDRLIIPDVAGAAIRRLATQSVELPLYAVGTDTFSTAAVNEKMFWRVPQACTLVSAYYTAATASTPTTDGGSCQTLILTRYTGTYGTGTTAFSATVSNSTPLAAAVPLSLGTAVVTAMAAGNVLSAKSTLTGTATLPCGVLTVNYTID